MCAFTALKTHTHTYERTGWQRVKGGYCFISQTWCIQSCQPLCFGRSLLHPRALHYAATLMVISLRSPSEFIFSFFLIPCVHVGIMLVAPQPIGVRILTSWPIVAFGSTPAHMRHFLARRLPFSVISNRHAEARSWKRAPGWWISPKKLPPKFPGRVWYRTVYVRCTINAERQACEVQRLLLQFLAECTMSNNTSTWSVTSTKEKW